MTDQQKIALMAIHEILIWTRSKYSDLTRREVYLILDLLEVFPIEIRRGRENLVAYLTSLLLELRIPGMGSAEIQRFFVDTFRNEECVRIRD